MALKAKHDQPLDILTCLWVGNLLLKGHFYKAKNTGKTYLSLGFHGNSALGWEVEEVETGLFALATEQASPSCWRQRVSPLCTHVIAAKGNEANEEFAGVPVEICNRLSRLVKVAFWQTKWKSLAAGCNA